MTRRRRLGAIAGATALVVAGFVLLEIASVYIGRAGGRRGRDSVGTMIVGFLPVYVGFVLLTPAVVWLARRLPVTLARPRTLAVHLIAAPLFAAVHLGALSLYHHALSRGAFALAPNVARLLGAYLVPEVFLYGAIAAVAMVLDARRALRDRELAAAQLGKSLAEARLAALRGQLHPHFLFNALNSVGMLIREERARDALQVLAELGALLRTLLRDGGAHEVPLAAELDFSRRYLALEQVRFGDRLLVSVDAPDELHAALVPSLVLQPLVENAVRHGVARRAGPGRVAVRVWRERARLCVEVANDGPPPESGATGTGLAATRARLASLYGDDQELSLAATPTGAVARASLPYHIAPVTP